MVTFVNDVKQKVEYTIDQLVSILWYHKYIHFLEHKEHKKTGLPYQETKFLFFFFDEMRAQKLCYREANKLVNFK